MLDVLKEVLCSWNELEPRLLLHVEHHIQTLHEDDDLLAAKRQQREEVRDQLLLFVRTLTKKTQADLAPEIARLEAQRDSLDAEIEGLQRRRKFQNIDPAAVVATLKQKMQHLADEVDTLPKGSLIDVVHTFTAGLTADMETKDVEFAFHLPSWMALDTSSRSLSQLCAGTRSESSAGMGTQHDAQLFVSLDQGTCQFIRHQRATSCKCSRRAA